MTLADHPRLALYWGAACGGCDMAVLEIGERLLDLAAAVELVFWPCVLDFKRSDVIAMSDGSIDVCLFNGAVRSTEQHELAVLLRRKSKLLVAFGACAHIGGVPGLANLYDREALLSNAYLDCPSASNPDRTLPRALTEINGCELRLPSQWDTVLTLADVVPVDYVVPGCPPTEKMTWSVIEAILNGGLPEPGNTVVGAGDKVVCSECPYEQRETPIMRFVRPHLRAQVSDARQCLLEQGLLCLGPATRSGCEARCLRAAMPCRGCYGPATDVSDQGAKMIGALAGMVEAQGAGGAKPVIDQIIDPMGTLYRFGLASSTLVRRRRQSKGAPERGEG